MYVMLHITVHNLLLLQRLEKPITAPDVISLYQLCTFESALFEQYNICDLFTIESLQVILSLLKYIKHGHMTIALIKA